MNREIEQGKRTGLPPGYRFIPSGITSRGVMGESMEKLLDWLSDYGVKNRGVMGYFRARERRSRRRSRSAGHSASRLRCTGPRWRLSGGA